MTDPVGGGDHLPALTDTASASNRGGLVPLYLDDQKFMVRMVPQCLTCQSTHREQIEVWYMSHRSYRAIAQSIPKTSRLWFDDSEEDDVARVALVIRRLGNHFRNGHGNADQMVSRQVMEAIAQSQGIDTDAMGGTIINEVGLLTELQRRGFEDLLRTNKPVPLNVVLRAAELTLKYKEVANGTDGITFQKGLEALFETAQEIFTEDELQTLFARIQNNPDVRTAFLALSETTG